MPRVPDRPFNRMDCPEGGAIAWTDDELPEEFEDGGGGADRWRSWVANQNPAATGKAVAGVRMTECVEEIGAQGVVGFGTAIDFIAGTMAKAAMDEGPLFPARPTPALRTTL